MAPPVYTTTFLTFLAEAGGEVSEYVVPSGFIADVKDIDVAAFATSETGYSIAVSVGPSTPFYVEVPPGWTGSIPWRGRVVAAAGERITVTIGTGPPALFTWITISGFLLTAP